MIFSYIEKRPDKKVRVNFNNYDVTACLAAHNYNTYYYAISQEVKAIRQSNLLF